MKTKTIAVIVIAFATGGTSLAQDMVEYSHVAAKPPVSLQGLANKIDGSQQKSAAQGGSGPQIQTVPSSKTGAPAETIAQPKPPALFILADGKQVESSHYMLTAQSLVIQDGEKPQTIPLVALNREATITANQKRGLNVKFPNSPSQMTISF